MYSRAHPAVPMAAGSLHIYASNQNATSLQPPKIDRIMQRLIHSHIRCPSTVKCQECNTCCTPQSPGKSEIRITKAIKYTGIKVKGCQGSKTVYRFPREDPSGINASNTWKCDHISDRQRTESSPVYPAGNGSRQEGGCTHVCSDQEQTGPLWNENGPKWYANDRYLCHE
jgi:RNase P subunit RPR2